MEALVLAGFRRVFMLKPSYNTSAVILLLESTLIIGGRIIADYPIIGQNLCMHNICM